MAKMSQIDKIVKEMTDTIKSVDNKKTSAYDTQAEVLRVEGDTAWVHIPGGVDETPVKLTMNASPGDIVQLRVSGGRAWIQGNATAPPTDDTAAKAANNLAHAAGKAARKAFKVAEGIVYDLDNNYSDTEETSGLIDRSIENIVTYTFYKYASNLSGADFSDDDSLQYRGVYSSIENQASSDPSDYLWEINPSWAVKYADNYIEDEVSTSGFRIVSPDPTTYARFTALFMAFFMNDVLQMRMGYDAVNEVYGVLAKNIFALGSGAGVKFDGSTEATTRGRFVWEIRDNGHLSHKRF